MKEYKIAFVIYTNGLEYDDRLRKEILTLQKVNSHISPYIYAVLPKNEETRGITSYGIPYKSLYLPSRDKYPAGKKAFIKALDFYWQLKKELKAFDAIWCANMDAVAVVLLARTKFLIWDLHELPEGLYENRIKRCLLKRLFNRCHLIIHANQQRRDFLASLSKGLIDKNKHFVLRNYPNFSDVDNNYDAKYQSFKEWKGNRKCVYLQGLQDNARAGFEAISSVLNTGSLISVVVGNVYPNEIEKLKALYSDNVLSERVMFVGKIPQLKIPQYLELCDFTMVFYKNLSPNNFYCEANRFYQAVSLGVPVIVGCNPSMKELVDQYKFGIAIEDDGHDVSKIEQAIKFLLSKREFYHNNCLQHRNVVSWDSQISTIKVIDEKISSIR